MKISLNLIFAFFVLVGYAVSDLILPPLGRTVLKTLKESKMIEHTSQRHMSNRVCGSPASDAYASVDRNCLIESPTATWFMENVYGNKDMLQIHIEKNADYDGIAVRWGLGNKVAHVEECAQMCLDHKVNLEDGTGFGPLPCNAFVYCREERCFEPDAYRDQHAKGDCWLKFTEGPANPEINLRGTVTNDQKIRHGLRDNETKVAWDAGVVLPKGVKMLNGTFGPRYYW